METYVKFVVSNFMIEFFSLIVENLTKKWNQSQKKESNFKWKELMNINKKWII